MPVSPSLLGENLRAARQLRGWSQRTLALRAGLSNSTVSRLESGTRTSIGVTLLNQLCSALDCPSSDLTSGMTIRPHSNRRALSDGVRKAMIGAMAHRTRGSVTHDEPVREIRRHIDGCDYNAAARLVTSAIESGNGGVYLHAAQVAYAFGDLATAWLAVDRFRSTGFDQANQAVAVYQMARILLSNGSRAGAIEFAESALRTLSTPHAAELVSAVGMLHLLLACAKSQGGRERRELQAHLRAAAALAPPDPEAGDLFGFWFCATNVELWRLAVAVNQRDIATAQAIAGAIDQGTIGRASRLAAFHLDLARLQMLVGQPASALSHLSHAERAAPQYVYSRPVTRDLVGEALRSPLSDTSRRRLRALLERLESW